MEKLKELEQKERGGVSNVDKIIEMKEEKENEEINGKEK